jgi:hypothetical protein
MTVHRIENPDGSTTLVFVERSSGYEEAGFAVITVGGPPKPKPALYRRVRRRVMQWLNERTERYWE